MAESIAQKVAEFLKKNPAATNSDLYKKFPKVRENTLRNYRSKFKSGVKSAGKAAKVKPGKKSSKAKKTESASLRSKVFEFFQNNPNATNKKLYEEFSDYSKNKLRHYKASFFKSFDATAAKAKQNQQKVSGRLKKAISRKAPDISDLNKRVEALEKKIDNLIAIVEESPEQKEMLKTALSNKSITLDKRIKELEENLLGFLSQKKDRIKIEISSLDELQQVISEKINTFFKGLKSRK